MGKTIRGAHGIRLLGVAMVCFLAQACLSGASRSAYDSDNDRPDASDGASFDSDLPAHVRESPLHETTAASEERPSRPNFVVVMADDLGFGDLGVYGSRTAKTPHLDTLASQGMRFTQAYAGNTVCTPSRAALLTGRAGRKQRLPGRVGGVYFPDAPGGMALEEVTIAEVLAKRGYATAIVGKWHLGDAQEFLPTRQGFDTFFGLPYSNNMDPLPVFEDEEVVNVIRLPPPMELAGEPDSELSTLTEQYTERALAFIRDAHADGRPFLLYYPTHLPHAPITPSAAFAGRSAPCEGPASERPCGRYADVLMELDASVGAIVSELSTLGIAQNTLVVFTSDNGAWLELGADSGSNGPLRAGKGTTFEGGYRVPLIATWPGTIPAGVVEDTPVAMVDWFPTVVVEAGAELPTDRRLDGVALGPLLRGVGERNSDGPFRFIYYRIDNTTPGAFREGRWKYKAAVTGREGLSQFDHEELLFDLSTDPGEITDLAADHPDVLARLRLGLLAAQMRSRELKQPAPAAP
ncbi:MAG: sulfatase [Myxococcales bacterium]|nr:sulfatase [Myxococcales bacterium]